MVRVLFFASLREALGTGREDLQLASPATVSTLVETLRGRGGAWSEQLAPERRWRVAVNQNMARLGDAIGDGDEVAIFPPVTGG
ncbi:MAG TPA: molybdopterin converting factor subunit 1 [Usitatibacteraceae bacterium]|nr:molybdopterin converting factor subunit 1 [Usitatibacteraceae bacterium]